MVSLLRRYGLAAFCTAAVAWTTLVLAAPLLAAGPRTSPVNVRLASLVYVTGGIVCHQRPERSFHVAGMRLAVCGRCTGLYLSGTAGLLVVAMKQWRRRRGGRAGDEGRMPSTPALVLAAAPTAATLALEWLGLWSGSNIGRALAALPLGLVVGMLVGESLSFRVKL